MTVQKISTVSFWLVGFIATLSFALSYSALRDVAVSNGVTGPYEWRSYIWPLIIDGGLVVFALAVVRSSLTRDRQWWLWFLVGLLTAATIYFNYTHADNVTLTPVLVAITPPIVLFLSFETLMSMLRNDVNKSNVTQSISDLSQERTTIAADLSQMSKQREKLEARLSQLHQEIGDIELTPVEKRRQQIPALLSDGMTVNEIASQFNVTNKTIYRDIDTLGVSLPTNGSH